MSYTPGPWTIQYSTNDYEGNLIYANSVVDSTLLTVYYTRAIAATVTEEASEATPEDEANARLIAAAPDLLAALKDVAEQIAAYDYLHGENSCAIDDAPALAAIRDLYPCYDPTSNIYPATKATGQEGEL
jgi:hypothetical protein